MALTAKQKLNIYLFGPLVQITVVFVTLALLEVGWPPWPNLVGLSLGIIIVGMIRGKYFAHTIIDKGTTHPTKKQLIGRVIFFSIGGAFILFVLIRFFYILLGS
ncbi:hypothetical protein CR194_17200 [Salipaludibacillus keqinensis]|jgi:hypothetical protein|uniref:Uncharacterized protein n=1 Tax=Salipaludibacillus keqinensis TaxID=2045207 RepID=A0A323T7S3_9BACI|nr:hypothetical protein [Salipaludibacillus keqinensis]PYZ91938.1 hypothetical protein CR194_17200 [Salipaludibacillus keqinensis]